jgi:peroxiredoxin (alkyl hydroperoxide reductase subunit C)
MTGETVHSLPLIGDKFPSFEVQTTKGIFSIPGDFEGKWMVLFSHPGDFTPVCTTEFVAFAKRNDEFKRLNTKLIGLSVDQVFAHIKWIEWIKEKFGVEVTFPVIADDLGKMASRLGMIHPNKGHNTVRAVFVVDPKSTIRAILYYPQEVGRKVEEILRMIKAMQIADANKVAMPEGWPDNELIGSKVLLPPAKDIQTAEQRKDSEESFDWWFVFKNLS